VLAAGAKIFRMERTGGARPSNVNLGPPNISESTRARKLKLKHGRVLDLGANIFPQGASRGAEPLM